MILQSQVCCQHWLTTKMQYSKSQLVSQRFLNATDTRIIFHGLQEKTNVVCSEDTSFLVFMVFAYAGNKINEM